MGEMLRTMEQMCNQLDMMAQEPEEVLEGKHRPCEIGDREPRRQDDRERL